MMETMNKQKKNRVGAAENKVFCRVLIRESMLIISSILAVLIERNNKVSPSKLI